MPKFQARTFSNHIQDFGSCSACDLHKQRGKMVLARGKLPCNVLFIGEAPGVSEDTLGAPFVGPAGIELDRWITCAQWHNAGLTWAFTNLVGCIPLDPEGVAKVKEPPKEAIQACQPRLVDLIEIAAPTVLVAVGKLSEKWLDKTVNIDNYECYSITHPAAVLRMGPERKPMTIQQQVITLIDIMEELRNA